MRRSMSHNLNSYRHVRLLIQESFEASHALRMGGGILIVAKQVLYSPVCPVAFRAHDLARLILDSLQIASALLRDLLYADLQLA